MEVEKKTFRVMAAVFVTALVVIIALELSTGTPSKDMGDTSVFFFKLSVFGQQVEDFDVFLDGSLLGSANESVLYVKSSSISPGSGEFRFNFIGRQLNAPFEISSSDLRDYSGISHSLSEEDVYALLSGERQRLGELSENIVFADPQVEEWAQVLSDVCDDGDIECKVMAVYNNVTSELKLFNASLMPEGIRSPGQTFTNGGGTNEDLTVLIQSLYENMGLKTYTVSTGDRLYALVCGVDRDQMINYSSMTFYFYDETKVFTENLTVEPLKMLPATWPDSFKPTDIIQVHVAFLASEPIDIFYINNQSDMDMFVYDKEPTFFKTCSRINQTVYSGACAVRGNGGLVLMNSGSEPSDVVFSYKIIHEFWPVDPAEMDFSFYELGGRTCVVVDPSLADRGYVGGELTLYEPKVFFDPLTGRFVGHS